VIAEDDSNITTANVKAAWQSDCLQEVFKLKMPELDPVRQPRFSLTNWIEITIRYVV